jgi:hypothetical protein
MANKKNSSGGANTYGDGDTSNSRLTGAVEGARDKLSGLGSTASGQVDNSPLIALGAGAAIGAVLAAVIPASQKERELLAPLGSKISTAGTGAVDRARDLSKQKFDEMAGEKVREFFGASGSSNA